MGGEPSPFALAITGLLIALVFALVSAVGSAHLHHPFGGNTDTAQGSIPEIEFIIKGSPRAQSFQVVRPFTLTRVALDVSDPGAPSPLWVGIRLANSSNPDGVILAGSTNSPFNSFSWTNFDLTPSINVTPGIVDWIFANSSASHRWWNSGRDANQTGEAAIFFGGTWWKNAADFAFQLYSWVRTAATITHRSATTTVRAGAEADFTVGLNVTGLDPAYNVTFDYWYTAGDLTFLRDTSGTSGLGLTRMESPGHVRYSGSEALPGSYGFTVTFLVNDSVRAGTIETTNLSFRYRDLQGAVATVPGIALAPAAIYLPVLRRETRV